MITKSMTSKKGLVEKGHQQSHTKGRKGMSKSKGRGIAKDECAFHHEKVLEEIFSEVEEEREESTRRKRCRM